jgi:phosphohistidine phosphatase SixA
MDYLIIARHGSYDPDKGSLNRFGQKDIGFLAEKINQLNLGGLIHIISSSAPRAKESAEIVKQSLESTPNLYNITPIQFEDLLWSSPDRPITNGYFNLNQLPEIVCLIESSDAETVIVMTHDPLASALPNLYMKNMGKEEIYSIDKAEAVYIDIKNKTASKISPK